MTTGSESPSSEAAARRPGGGPGGLSERTRGALVLAGLLVVGVGFLWACEALKSNPQGEFFDGTLWWWGWLLLPVASGVASYLAPRVTLWAAPLLVGPQLVAVIVGGAIIGHDPGDGANLWPVGLVFVVFLGVICWLVGRVVAGLATDTRLRS